MNKRFTLSKATLCRHCSNVWNLDCCGKYQRERKSTRIKIANAALVKALVESSLVLLVDWSDHQECKHISTLSLLSNFNILSVSNCLNVSWSIRLDLMNGKKANVYSGCVSSRQALTFLYLIQNDIIRSISLAWMISMLLCMNGIKISHTGITCA